MVMFNTGNPNKYYISDKLLCWFS